MNSFEQIEMLLAESKQDQEKFFSKGNATAGKRLRKTLSSISKLCKDGREAIQQIKNS